MSIYDAEQRRKAREAQARLDRAIRPVSAYEVGRKHQKINPWDSHFVVIPMARPEDQPVGQYIYVLKPTRLGMLTDGPDDRETAILQAHVTFLDNLLAAGEVVLFGRTQTADSETFGIVVFETSDDSTANAIMKGDPCVEQGVMTATLYPFGIAGLREATHE